MCRKSVGITPFLNQQQIITAIDRSIIVVLDISILSAAGIIDPFCVDRLQEFISLIRFAFVCYVQYDHGSLLFQGLSFSVHPFNFQYLKSVYSGSAFPRFFWSALTARNLPFTRSPVWAGLL